MKKLLSIVLTALILSALIILPVSADSEAAAAPSFAGEKGLYAHGTKDKTDTEAWQLWQNPMDERNENITSDVKYFFLPSGTDAEKVDIYNAFSDSAVIDGVTLAPKSVTSFEYSCGRTYSVKVNSASYSLRFMRSGAEAAIYANNMNADGKGTELYEYLKQDKANKAAARSAVVSPDGSVDNTTIKKIKGRGNTTWGKSKKPFNITFSSNVRVGTMSEGKKYSLLANYQDATFSRNRILYDLSDAVGMPYASDSRYIDFYIDGVYFGSYQCCQKIEVGKNDLINDISDTDYINGSNLAEDFSFVLEIDPNYSEEDYHFRAGSTELTINSPELDPSNSHYEEVKNYISGKFSALNNLIANKNATLAQLSELMDVDSFVKIYLINELGKNWDSGSASFYMTHKKSPDGKWRFYASPVWDYDNSLGNAVGVVNDLVNMGVTDYESYEGWWCRYKNKSARDKNTKNFVGRLAVNTAISQRAATIWFENFVPAIKLFKSSYTREGNLLGAERYYDLIKDSADMNYTRGWALTTSSWVADHSSLTEASYSLLTDTYKTGRTKLYPHNFRGEFDYAVDWMMYRTAWLSKQFSATYKASAEAPELGDVNGDSIKNITDVTLIQIVAAGYGFVDYNRAAADFNEDGTIDINDATALQKYIAAPAEQGGE